MIVFLEIHDLFMNPILYSIFILI